jgi:DNA-binding NtrC family response regulator
MEFLVACIVIAEDATHILNVLAAWMSRHGHQVLAAPSGRIALEHLKTQPVDLLITDVRMPDGDGITLTRMAFGVCPTLQWVVIITSCCDHYEILSQLAEPRVSVFPKPFSPSQLLREVERVTTGAHVAHAGTTSQPAKQPPGPAVAGGWT